LTIKAQTDSTECIVPDRPGVATSPEILSKRAFQIEYGLQYEKISDRFVTMEKFLFSSLLLRYGVAKDFEVRIQTDYALNNENDSTGKSTSHGMMPMTIGTKISLIKNRKLIPSISLLFNLTLPYVGQKELRPDNFAPSFLILLSNPISDKLNLCYNYGMAWDGITPEPTQLYAISLGINLNKRWNAFVENFGFFHKDEAPKFYVDGGFTYLINHHLQLDIAVAGYLSSFLTYYSLFAGIAWRI
jgi:hypothetical protein